MCDCDLSELGVVPELSLVGVFLRGSFTSFVFLVTTNFAFLLCVGRSSGCKVLGFLLILYTSILHHLDPCLIRHVLLLGRDKTVGLYSMIVSNASCQKFYAAVWVGGYRQRTTHGPNEELRHDSVVPNRVQIHKKLVPPFVLSNTQSPPAQ